jgi:5-(aminomethyl)-3-furanmethanol phosphate kinase
VLDARFVRYVSDANYVVELFNKRDVALMRDRLLHVSVA